MTENTTSYRAKGRAVVLAALMVLSVVAMGAAFAAPAAADHANEEAVIGDGDSVVQGQTAIVDVSGLTTTTDDQVTLYKSASEGADERIYNVDVDDSGTTANATFTTSNLDAGSYYLEGTQGNNVSFDVTVLDLENGPDGGTMFLSGSVEQGDNASLQLDSNEGDFVAEISSDSFSANKLAEMIDGATATDHDGNFVEVNGDATLNVTFAGVDPGTYNFTVAGAGTTAETTASIEVTEPGETTVGFEETVPSTTLGDHNTITVNMEETNSAELDITWGAEGLTILNGTVDAPNSDQVTFDINTHELLRGDTGNIVANEDGGSFTVNHAMDMANYGDNTRMDVFDRTSSFNMELTVDDEREDRGTFKVTDRSTESMSTYKVSGSLVDELTESNLESVAEDGGATDGAIAAGDYLAVVVEGDGFFGYDDSLQTLAEEGVYLNATHTNPGFGGQPDELDHETLITNESTSTLVSVYQVPDDQVDNGYNVSFNAYAAGTAADGTHNYDNPYTSETESFYSSFAVEEPSLSFDSDMYDVSAAEGQPITGTTNIAPGNVISVVAEAGGDNAFLEDGEGVVQADGTWTAEIDLSEEVQDVEFDLKADNPDYIVDGEAISATSEGIIGGGSGAAPFLSISADAPSSVTVDEGATLSVAVENGGNSPVSGTVTVTVNGETVVDGQEVSDLAADGSEDIVEHDLDTSSTGDISYSITTTGDDGEEDDSVEGTVTVEEESSGSGSESGGSETDGSDGDDGDDATPGFGVAIALVALLSAAMLALRRQD
ncbi:BGTF surface domain-containing protein [Halovivax cerinus]|uniref:BGTF surface domain-containing protein n=1 Tax=Halovivax cerinus TaxID=1487865 RepID=A0ABD5NMD1_9EURY|nr:BGTF surface domain-containing protein [Halovivax cerinus]